MFAFDDGEGGIVTSGVMLDGAGLAREIAMRVNLYFGIRDAVAGLVTDWAQDDVENVEPKVSRELDIEGWKVVTPQRAARLAHQARWIQDAEAMMEKP